MPKVYNQRDKKIPKDAVYVGRPTMWGNPFIVGEHGTREEVVALYRACLLKAIEWQNIRAVDKPGTISFPDGWTLTDIDLNELRGKDLVCWCAPRQCHADVLLEIANDDANSETGQI